MARSLRPRHAAAWPDSTLRLKLPATSACKRWEIRPCHPNVHHRFKSASATGALTASAAPHNPDELLRCSELTLRASRRHPPPSRRSSPHCLGGSQQRAATSKSLGGNAVVPACVSVAPCPGSSRLAWKCRCPRV